MLRERWRTINGVLTLIYSDAPDFAPPVIDCGDTGPMLIADSMHPTECPADGRTYDSKSQYYRAVKAKGGEIIGGEALPRRHPGMDDRALDRAIDMTFNRLGIS